MFSLWEKLAGWTGLEPAAFRVTGGRYNQLNYHPATFWRIFYSYGRFAVQQHFLIIDIILQSCPVFEHLDRFAPLKPEFTPYSVLDSALFNRFFMRDLRFLTARFPKPMAGFLFQTGCLTAKLNKDSLNLNENKVVSLPR